MSDGDVINCETEGTPFSVEVYPVCFEAVEKGAEDLVFKVEAFDDMFASVTIPTCVNVERWDAIAPKIREALVALRLGEANDRS